MMFHEPAALLLDCVLTHAVLTLSPSSPPIQARKITRPVFPSQSHRPALRRCPHAAHPSLCIYNVDTPITVHPHYIIFSGVRRTILMLTILYQGPIHVYYRDNQTLGIAPMHHFAAVCILWVCGGHARARHCAGCQGGDGANAEVPYSGRPVKGCEQLSQSCATPKTRLWSGTLYIRSCPHHHAEHNPL